MAKNKDNTENKIVKICEAHPKMIRFLMFSVVLFLLLLMVAIQTGDAGVKKNAASSALSDTGENQGNEQALEGETAENLADDAREESDLAEDKEGAADGEDTEAADTPVQEENDYPQIELDAFEMLGMEYGEVEDKLGRGIAQNKANRCYYMAAGALLSYDADTKKVTSVEFDDSGDGQAELSLLGVKLGDDLEKAKNTINEQGIDIIGLQDNSFMCDFYLGKAKNTIYEIYITGEKNKVSSCSICIK